MSIGGLMRTSVSGMNAQATRLAGVSDNIANANTNGYKRQSTEFSTMVLASGGGQYNSGIVEANTRQIVSQQGVLSYTTNATSSQAVDLAINGKGFLVVSDGSGGTFLTRAGSFVKNGNGDLVNAGGYVLQGYPLPGGEAQGVLNGFAGLQNVNLNATQLRLKPTDAATFRMNLPKEAQIVPTPTAGTAATVPQTAAFDISGFAATVKSLRFDVTVDGTTTKTITLTPGDSKTVNDLTIDDVVSAVNLAFGRVVATKTSDDKLVLTSPTKGTESGAELGATQFLDVEGEVIDPAPAGTLTGLAPGTDAGEATAPTGTLPGDNGADTNEKVGFTATRSMVVYDDAGKEVILDVYMTKKTAGNEQQPEGNNVWEYAIFDRAKAGTGITAPFPYTGGALVKQDVTFDRTGTLVSSANIDLTVPNGQLLRIDLSGSSQVGKTFEPLAVAANGNPPGSVDQIEISASGIVSAKFASGSLVALFQIPMAMVESPDNLRAHSGNVFSVGQESGEVLLGFGGQGGLGSLVHGALEQSTVDLASELTTMIESQRSYTANSKVFQTGSEILDVLVNLKR